ncbi:MAG TPA: GAF domain-containing protein [Armatimonadota bacterium]|jgi:hypothetical protein
MSWKPADFIVFGRYCDVAPIREAVEALRKRDGAEAAVLLVFQGAHPFRSLLLLAHQNPSLVRPLERDLVRAPLSLENGGGLAGLLWDRDLSNDQRMDQLLSSRAFRRIRPHFHSKITARVLLRQDTVGYRADTQQQIGTSIAVVLINSGGRSSQRWAAAHMARLYTMVCASAPVVVHKDLFLLKIADSVIDKSGIAASLQGLPTPQGPPAAAIRPHDASHALDLFSQRLLDAALRLTDSATGSVYLAGSEKGRLRLAAQMGAMGWQPEIDTSVRAGVVGWVYRKRRPLLINNLAEFRESHPHISYLPNDDALTGASAELAVPITHRQPESSSVTVLGVIRVEKSASSRVSIYTYRELAMLRDLAQRLCLWRSNMLFSASARALASLTQRNSLPTVRSDTEQGHSADGAKDIPLDALPAVDTMRDTLSHIHSLTHSASATVCLVSADSTRLVRLCTCPASDELDARRSIPLDARNSVNAWVARTGRECYIPNLASPDAFGSYESLKGCLSLRTPIVCELCVPIVLHARLVGTLHLESQHEGAYAECLFLVRAIAEQMALSLAHARRSIEHHVLSLQANATLSLHQLLKCIDRLSTLAKLADDHTAGAINQLCRDMQSCLMTDPVAAYHHATTVAEILGELAKELQIAQRVTWETPIAAECYLPLPYTDALRVAMQQILQNAYDEALRSHDFHIRVLTSVRDLAGRRFLRVVLRNPLLTPMSDDLAARLYRVPIRTDRPHIGAFLAGAILREIGGDVYIGRHDRRVMCTVIELPVLST